MSDYFFGRFADLISPLEKSNAEIEYSGKENETRVEKLKSNFLNSYIYPALIIFILLLVAIFYFVSR